MDTHFDVIVVGSGFGGSVAAYRMAEAGLRVCLLERGKRYPPGSFPRSPHLMARSFWDPSEGGYGMFDVWSFRGLESLVASGLGGGSLIYANVLIRKDEKWFVHEEPGRPGYEHWPVTRAELEPHYDAAEAMLQATPYPFDHPPYDVTPKTRAMRDAAERLGLAWCLPKLAVTFGNPGEAPAPALPIREARPNLHGLPRTTCRLCGECDIGCNYGSKNTLDYNYLTEALRLGAEIRTLCEVKRFEPLDGKPGGKGYAVEYVEHDPEREGRKLDTSTLPLRRLTAERLVLGAGTLGTSYLLLRLRADGTLPQLSRRLGTRFCGNGDLLTFVTKCRASVNGRRRPRLLDASYGPVITSAIRVPDALDEGEGRGFYIEDAGYPVFINWILEMMDPVGLGRRAVVFGARRLQGLLGWSTRSNISADMARLVGEGVLSSSSIPLLGMGRDVPDGNMRLRGQWLDVDWRTRTSTAFFERMRQQMRDLAEVWEGRFSDNLTWYLKRTITVHPLGGCPMGRTEAEGVVDSYGQVFRYPGLFIADGSVMPGPVGANPSLTIAALADRFSERILEQLAAGRAAAARR